MILNQRFLTLEDISCSIFCTYIGFPHVRLGLLLILQPHFSTNGSKKMSKNLYLNKISYKILYFITNSFNNFFETGKFKEKTNSVQW